MKRFAVALVLFFSIQLGAQTNPRVRAITGFVRLDRGQWQAQVGDTLEVLRKVQHEFEAQGYQVQSLRIVTQPVGELVAGLPEEQALAFLEQFDQLSAKDNFIPNVGPAMMHDSESR